MTLFDFIRSLLIVAVFAGMVSFREGYDRAKSDELETYNAAHAACDLKRAAFEEAAARCVECRRSVDELLAPKTAIAWRVR